MERELELELKHSMLNGAQTACPWTVYMAAVWTFAPYRGLLLPLLEFQNGVSCCRDPKDPRIGSKDPSAAEDTKREGPMTPESGVRAHRVCWRECV